MSSEAPPQAPSPEPSVQALVVPEANQPTLYVEESRALPLVSIAIAIRFGSASDPPGQEGLTRIVARMLRRGCRGMTSQQIEERIDLMGAELGADVAPSVVTLHADVISRSLDDLVELLGTLLAEPTFDEVELGRLLRETQGELVEARDNDRLLVARHFRRVLFDGHPYARPVSGHISTVQKLTRDDVAAHYRRHFVRGNVAIALSGDVTPERARTLAERLVSGLPEGPRETDATPSPTPPEGRHLVFVDKPERTQAQILIGGIGSHPRDADHVALHTATTIFGGTFTSRLMREIRSKRGWSYGAYARLAYDRRPDAFSVWTFPASKDAAACIQLELELLDAWREKGVVARELGFTKRYLVRSHAFDVDTPTKRVHQKLDVDLFDLPPDHHSHYVEHVRAVTLDAANRAVARHITSADIVIAVVATHREIGEAVAAAIPGLRGATVVPYDAD